MRPGTQTNRSYTIWFSQRTGSTWFAGMLEATGTAGMPREHLNFADAQAALTHYGVTDSESLATAVRSAGTGADGVFGIKHSFHQPAFDSLLEVLTPDWKSRFGSLGRLAAWEQAFPEHRHIFITRRNKVRLAVSWWRAIQSEEWHRKYGAPAAEADLSGAFDFWAIDHLLNEAVMREAGIAELFAPAGVAPLTLAYEDIVLSPEGAFHLALDHLGLPHLPLPAPQFAPIADELSEKWTQRYRKKKQGKWTNRGW